MHVKGRWKIRGKGQTGRETKRVKLNNDCAAVQKGTRKRRTKQEGQRGRISEIL